MKAINTFAGKKVLFIAPQFYNYHSTIIKNLELLDAEVTFYPEIKHTLLYRFSHKLSKNLEKKIEHNYMQAIIDAIEFDAFDIVLVIRGSALTCSHVQEMRRKLPRAAFVLYQWDSVKQNNYLELVDEFDTVKTFDRLDSKQYGLDYYPLFYSEDYEKLYVYGSDKKYSLSFFGAYHSDRLEIIKYFDKLLNSASCAFKYHLYIKKIALLRRLLTREIKFSDLKYFKTYSVGLDEITECYSQSVAVLDVELDIQSGLSIRTFEVLGSGLKLITTNQNIQQEDFYLSDIMCVIDRENIDVDLEFFATKKNVRPSEFEMYRLDRWLVNLVQ